MRHLLLFSVFCLLLSVSARADERSAQIIERMSATINGWRSYRVEFTIEGIEGQYLVSAGRYYLQMSQVAVGSDGRMRWEINSADREVILDRIDPADQSILSDPTQLFDFPDAAFSHRFGGTSGGRQIVLLTPKEEGLITRIRLEIDPATALPTTIEYAIRESGGATRIEVRAIRPERNLSEEMFRFEAAKYKGFEIIDFR